MKSKVLKVTFTSTVSVKGDGPDEEEVVVEATYVAGDPGVRTFRNGDPGYPPSGPEVDITSIKRTDEATAFWHPPSLIVDYDTLSEADQDRLIEEAINKAEQQKE